MADIALDTFADDKCVEILHKNMQHVSVGTRVVLEAFDSLFPNMLDTGKKTVPAAARPEFWNKKLPGSAQKSDFAARLQLCF